MADQFDTPMPEVKRDSYGRYILPHPETGKEKAFTRVTTFAKTISDEYGLTLWKERMVAKGMALRPDLAALAASMDVKADSKRLNQIAGKAKEAAGSSAAANLGTAVHSFTEMADTGHPMDAVPEVHRADVKAYSDTLAAAGITVVPGMVERITCALWPGVAGTFDRVYQLADGRRVIGDLKTGRDLSYSWMEIAIQLGAYRYGLSSAGVFDLRTSMWSGPVEGIDEVVGIVAHVPVGSASCTLYEVDLKAGMKCAGIAVAVREARSESKKFAKVLAAPVPLRDWEEEFASVVTREHARALWHEAKQDSMVTPERMSTLVALGQAALTNTL